MSPKPLKPPASFSVWGVWIGLRKDSLWASRRLAERRCGSLMLGDPDPGAIEVIEHSVWADAEAFEESRS